MVVGSSTAFAGVFTFHADGFVVVFFIHTPFLVVVGGCFVGAFVFVVMSITAVFAVFHSFVVVVATHGAVVSSVGVAGGTIPSFALTTTTATQHKGF